MDYTTLNKHITDAFPQMSKRLQIAARYVLDRPDDVALMSMRSLATAAGVHPSTMVRLARELGFPGYTRFREPFQLRLRQAPESYLARARGLQERSGDREALHLLGELSDLDHANLNATLNEGTYDLVASAAKTLSTSKRLFVVGMRSLFPVAFSFHYACRMIRDNVFLLDGRGGTFADDLRDFGKGDVIFAVSFDPYTQETVRAVEFAIDHGGKAVVLTDSPVSPLSKGAEHVILIRNESPSFFNSITSAIAVVESLAVLMIAEGGTGTLEAITYSEEQLGAFDAYWHRKRKNGEAGGKAGHK